MRWLFDRIYIYSYAFLRVPNGDRAYQAATFVVALTIGFHIMGLLILLSGFAHRNLMDTFGKPGIVITTLAIYAAAIWYFQGAKQRARRLLRDSARELALPRTKWIGLAIIVWTFSVLFLSIAVVIFLHREHVI